MADKAHEANFTGTMYVRPVGRGIFLGDPGRGQQLDEWAEQALHDAGVVDQAAWSGNVTVGPVRLTLRVERLES